MTRDNHRSRALTQSVLEVARAAGRVTALTGAGVSAESGVPTYRDVANGLWAEYDPMTLATPAAWNDDPGLVWAWYQRRRAELQSVTPNAAHRALAEWGRHRIVRIVTQNVDDLHERAGSADVIHVHGSLHRSHCDACGDNYATEIVMPCTIRVEPPECGCGGRVRPGVVWFGETPPEVDFAHAIRAVQDCDLLLVIGTSGLVYPAAGLPQLARTRGCFIVEINPAATGVSELADVAWHEAAGIAIPALVDALSLE